MFNSELPDVNINDFYKYYFYNLHKLRFWIGCDIEGKKLTHNDCMERYFRPEKFSKGSDGVIVTNNWNVGELYEKMKSKVKKTMKKINSKF